jgi:cytochrome c5
LKSGLRLERLSRALARSLAGPPARGENALIAGTRARSRAKLTFALVCLAAACARSGERDPAGRVQLEPALARTYQSACASCHARAGTGAPLAGSDADWSARRAQGLDVLLTHSVNGFRGMPPLGGCGLCSESDLRALVAYTAGIAESPR